MRSSIALIRVATTCLLAALAASSAAAAGPPQPHAGARVGAYLHDFAIPVPPARGDSPDVRLRVDHRAVGGPVGDGVRLVVGSTITRRGPGGRVPSPDATLTSELAVDGVRLVGDGVLEPEVADGSRYVYDPTLNVWRRTIEGAVFTYGEQGARRLLVGPGFGPPGAACPDVDSLCNTAAWELTSAVDSSGHRITYTYEAGPAAAPGKARAQALRPASIEWQGGLHALRFFWEDRPDSRLDASTGGLELHSVRLARVEVTTSGLDWATFELEYTDEAGAGCDGAPVDAPAVAPRVSRLRRVLRTRSVGAEHATRVERCFERTADGPVGWTAPGTPPLATPHSQALSSEVAWGAAGDGVTHRAAALPVSLDGDGIADLLVVAFVCDAGGCEPMHDALLGEPSAPGGFERAPRFPHAFHAEPRRDRISRAWRDALTAHLDGAWAHHGRGFAVLDLDRDGVPELLVEEVGAGAGPSDLGDVILYTFDPDTLAFDAGALVPIDALDLRLGSFADIDGDGRPDLILRAHQAHCVDDAFDDRGLTTWISNAAVPPFLDSADEVALDTPLERPAPERPAAWQALRDACTPGPHRMRGPPLHPPVEGSGESLSADHVRYLDVNGDGLADAVAALHTCWGWHEGLEPASRGWVPVPGSAYSRVFLGDGRGGFVDSGLDAGPPFLSTSKVGLSPSGEFTLAIAQTTVGMLDLDRDGHAELARDGLGWDWRGATVGFDTAGPAAWVTPDYDRPPVAADFDGDGFPDLLALDTADGQAAGGGWSSTLHLSTREVVPGRVVGVHSREEGPVEIGYGFSAQAPNVNPHLHHNLEVVQDVTGPDGIIRFAYAEGAADAAGSLGFGVVERREMSGARTRWGFAQQRDYLVGPLLVAARWRADGALHDAVVELHGHPTAGQGPRVAAADQGAGRGAFNPVMRTCGFQAGVTAQADLEAWLDACVGFERVVALPASWTVPTTTAALTLPAMDSPLLDDGWDSNDLAEAGRALAVAKPPEGVTLPAGGTDVADLRDPEAEQSVVMVVTEQAWQLLTLKPLAMYELGDVDSPDDDRVTTMVWQAVTPPGAAGPSFRLWERSVSDRSGERLQVVRRRWFSGRGFDLPTRVETCGRTDDAAACSVERRQYTQDGLASRRVAPDGGVTLRWFNECGRVWRERDPVGRVTVQTWDDRCLPVKRSWQGGSLATEHGPFNEQVRVVEESGGDSPARVVEITRGSGLAGGGGAGTGAATAVVLEEARIDALGTLELDYVDGFGRPLAAVTCLSGGAGADGVPACVPGTERVDGLSIYRGDGRLAGQAAAYAPGVEIAPTTGFEYDGLGQVVARHSPGHVLLGGPPAELPWLEGEPWQSVAWTTARQVAGPGYATRQTADGVTTEVHVAGGLRQTWVDGRWDETVTHDPFGRPVRVERAGEATELRTYGDDQRLATVALEQTAPCVPDGGETLDEACTWVRWFSYDAAGREAERVDADGRGQRFVFDAVGRPVERWDRARDGAEVLAETWAYVPAAGGSAPRVVHTDVPTGAASVTEHDALGRPRRRAVAELEEAWTWDARGEIATHVDLDGLLTAYEYDALGDLAGVRTAGGGLTSWVRDARGRVVSEVDADGATTEVRRTWSGLPAVVLNGGGHVLGWRRYDGAGRVTDALEGGVHRAAAYDSRGRLWREDLGVDPLDPPAAPMSWRELAYDEADRLVQETVWPVEGLTATTTTGYDAWGRRLSVSDAESAVTTYDYDEVGRLRRMVDGAGHRTTWRYDARGRLAQEERPREGATTYDYAEGVGYDHAISGSLGQLRRLSTTDGVGHVWERFIDAAGREVARTAPDGGRTEMSFVGLRVETQLWLGPDEDAPDGGGDGGGLAVPLREKRWSYEAGTGRVVTIAGPALPGFAEDDPSVFTVRYGWTDAGRPAGVEGPAGATSFTYQDGLLAGEEALGLSRTLHREGLSPRVTGEELRAPDGSTRIARHTFDRAGRLTSTVTTAQSADLVTLADATEQHFVDHNAFGAPEAEWRTVGGVEQVRHDWMYDATGRPLERTTSLDGSGTAHATTQWAWYGNGLLAGVTTPTGLGIAYDYEATFPHRLTQVRRVGGPSFAVFEAWDGRGLPTRWSGLGRTVELTWDALGRMATSTTLGGGGAGGEVDFASQRFDSLGFLKSESFRTSQGDELDKAYGYDDAGRLRWEQWTGDTTAAWDYVLDLAGDRLRTERSVGASAAVVTMDATYGAEGLLTHVDGAPLEYDPWRGVSVDQRDTAYLRGASGEVRAVVTLSQTLELGRDAEGLPVTVRANGGATRVTTWGLDAESHPLQVETGDGRHLTYVTAAGMLLARVTEAQTTWAAPLVVDGRGSIMRITNWTVPAGNAFGEGAMVNNPTERFSFQRMETHPGLAGVRFARHRAYDSQTGRFLSPDPLGLGGGLHREAYGAANPTRFSDAMGLSCTSFGGGVGGLGGLDLAAPVGSAGGADDVDVVVDGVLTSMSTGMLDLYTSSGFASPLEERIAQLLQEPVVAGAGGETWGGGDGCPPGALCDPMSSTAPGVFDAGGPTAAAPSDDANWEPTSDGKREIAIDVGDEGEPVVLRSRVRRRSAERHRGRGRRVSRGMGGGGRGGSLGVPHPTPAWTRSGAEPGRWSAGRVDPMGSAWEWAAGVRRWAGGVDWRSAGQAALEIGVGFTPLGVGYDLYNIARSAREVYRGEEGAAANLLMDSLGLLPGGDLLKVGRRFKRAADIADGLSDAARRLPASKFGTPGTFMVLEHSARTTPDQLRRKAGWLDGAARAGEARLTRSTRGVRTGGPQRRARAAGAIAPGHHADHMLDLQLGGADHIDNIASLHGGTNMSVGSQLRGQFGDLPDGTAVSRVFLQEPQGAPVVKAIEALGPGKALK